MVSATPTLCTGTPKYTVLFETETGFKYNGYTTCMEMIIEKCQQQFHALLGEYFSIPHISYITYNIVCQDTTSYLNHDIVSYNIVCKDTISYPDIRYTSIFNIVYDIVYDIAYDISQIIPFKIAYDIECDIVYNIAYDI
jgi:hypothetical protein